MKTFKGITTKTLQKKLSLENNPKMILKIEKEIKKRNTLIGIYNQK